MTDLIEKVTDCVATTSHVLLTLVSGLGLGAAICEASRGHYPSALFCLGTSFATGALTYGLQRKYEEDDIITEAYKIINQNIALNK